MSIYASTASVGCRDYRGSHLYPWEGAEPAEIGFAVIPDYVAYENGDGSRVMPWLRMSLNCSDRFAAVLLTEANARRLIGELQGWLDRDKRRPPRKRGSVR